MDPTDCICGRLKVGLQQAPSHVESCEDFPERELSAVYARCIRICIVTMQRSSANLDILERGRDFAALLTLRSLMFWPIKMDTQYLKCLTSLPAAGFFIYTQILMAEITLLFNHEHGICLSGSCGHLFILSETTYLAFDNSVWTVSL